VPIEPLPLTGRETGIDVGLTVVLITADGQPVEHPRHCRRAERALKKAQLRVSRRKKGSHRRRKAVHVLAKQQQQVRRQRSDFHHKTALALVRAYDTISVEAIRPANVSLEPPSRTQAGRARHLSAQWGQPQSRPEHEHSRRRMAPLPVHPRFQGSMRRQASGGGATGVDVAGL
jgi:transposase